LILLTLPSLALNENRAPFTPTLWKITPDNHTTNMKQVWFVGAHSSVGGSDDSHGLSDITLAWMIQQLTNYTKIEYDKKYLLDSRETFGPNHMDTPWSTEAWVDPYTSKWFWRFSGYKLRTPGKYVTAQDPKDVRTNEFVHRSVLRRIELQGKKYWHPDISALKEDQFGDVEQDLSWR
jgi:hypothetical protein